MIFLTEASEVVNRFMDKGMHVTPKALELMIDESDSAVDQVLSDLGERKDRPSIVTDEIVSRILESEETIPSTTPQPPSEKDEDVGPTATARSPVLSREEDRTRGRLERESEISKGVRERGADKVKILWDITGKSTTEGKVEDFIRLFRDRYEKLSSIIRSREGFQNYTELGNVVRHEGDVVNLVGLVNSKRETRKKDAWIIELEDLSGRAVIYIKDSQRNEQVIEKIGRVVTDEVIGVKAKVPDELRSGNRSPLVWGNEIVWPDVPVSRSSTSNEDQSEKASGYAVLISDLHVGSSMFLSEVFWKFLEWLNGSAGNKKQRKMANQVEYLIIAGDLVDGIGVYPGQQEELDIENVRDQYKRVANLLSRVPNDIHIIASPGNHDAVRLAEPQPALYTKVADSLGEANVQLVGNPALLNIEGVKFLIYHGKGFDDLVSAEPDLDRKDVVSPMKELLKKRHLAPIYGDPMGGRTPIAPEKEDHLVIDEVPDVLHCGHLHRYGCGEYRGILMVNSATFQEQTIFMKRQGVVPTPGHVPIVDLKTKQVRTINFA